MNYDNLNVNDLMKLLNDKNIKFKTQQERIIDFINNSEKRYIPYPKKYDDDFFQKIYKKKEFYENKYDIPNESKDIQLDLCPSSDKNFRLLEHQIMIRNYMNINTPYNSILLFHGMGSGKTMTSITVAENYKNVLADFNRKKAFILVSGDTIEQNFRREIHDINKGFNQGTFTDYMNYSPYDKDDVKQKKVNELIDKNYEIEHYQKLSNILSKKKEEYKNDIDLFKTWIKQTYSNRVFIIDEVHNLKLTDKDESTIKRYDAVKLIVQNSINIKLVLLSGTPMGHSVKEIIDILNLLLLNDKKPEIETKDIFKPNLDFNENGVQLLNKLSKSYISYITKENPYTFPKKKYSSEAIYITDFIQKKFDNKFNLQYKLENEYKIIPCKLQDEHKKNYLKILENKKVNVQDLIQIQLMNYNPLEEKKGKDKIIYNINFDDFKEANIKKLSIKFFKLLQNIKKANGPIFIYTNYIDKGVLMIASMLLRNGIDLFNSRKEPEILLSRKSPFKSKRFRPKKQSQLCAICNNKFHNDGDHKFTPMLFDYIIGQTTEEVQKKIITTFNSEENFNGSKLKIIIGSSVLKEGISFLKVRQLNIMEPWHNKSRLEQVIARGVRHCSHKTLDPKDRNVEVNLYCSIIDHKYETSNNKKQIIDKLSNMFKVDVNDKVKVDIDFARSFDNNPPLLSYDLIMYKRSEISNYYISNVDQILKENSFDCSLNRNLNQISDKYQCNGFDENFDYDLNEEDIDDSTYSNMFLLPYIKYVISFIFKYFKNNKIIDINILINNPSFQDDIYKTNNHYILRKALHMMIPNDDNLKNFPYIIQNINSNKKVNYGYLIKRIFNKDYIYIFKKFDDKNVFNKSNFEQSPIYDDYYNLDSSSFNLNQFLIKLEKVDIKNKNKKLSNVNYIDILNQKSKKNNVSNKNVGIGEANNIIRNNYQKVSNEGDYVGIKINRPSLKDRLWIRTSSKDNTGRDSITAFKKHELKDLIIELWKKIKDEDFKQKYNKDYIAYTTKSNKKQKLSKLLNDIFINLNSNKVEGKIWYQVL